MARSRISNIAYGIFPPFLSSVSLNVDTARRRRHRNEHFSLFHLGMPQIVGDKKCEENEEEEKEEDWRRRGGEERRPAGPQGATNDSQTRIHRPRPPHNSRRTPDSCTGNFSLYYSVMAASALSLWLLMSINVTDFTKIPQNHFYQLFISY